MRCGADCGLLVCRLLFNPIIDWWHKGPINAQLRQFVWSGAPIVRPLHFILMNLHFGLCPLA